MSNDIFVVIEQRHGKIQKVGLELLSEASVLAKELDNKVVAVVLGNNMAQASKKLFSHWADRVILVDDPLLETYTTEPYAKALTSIIKEYTPEIMLFGATSIGRDLAPRVAARVHTGLTADCTALAIDEETKLLRMTRPAFGGNIMATIICQEYRPQMATVRPGVMQRKPADHQRDGELEIHKVPLTEKDIQVEILEIVPCKQKCADITASKLIVAGGRGVGGTQGFELLHQLADALGGEVASTRIVVYCGWTEKERQVGQTGKTVRPDVYIACGISGALQHMTGMEDSGTIIAINKDATAPMMVGADLGIVGDVKEILPMLIRAVQNQKGSEGA